MTLQRSQRGVAESSQLVGHVDRRRRTFVVVVDVVPARTERDRNRIRQVVFELPEHGELLGRARDVIDETDLGRERAAAGACALRVAATDQRAAQVGEVRVGRGGNLEQADAREFLVIVINTGCDPPRVVRRRIDPELVRRARVLGVFLVELLRVETFVVAAAGVSVTNVVGGE